MTTKPKQKLLTVIINGELVTGTKKEIKKLELLEELKHASIFLPDGRHTMHEVIFGIGVSEKIEYYNKKEVMKPLKDRMLNNTSEIKNVVHDRGFKLKNGVIIRHIEKDVFALVTDCLNSRVRERDPKYVAPKGLVKPVGEEE